MSSEGLHRLKVWVKSRDLVVKIYREVIPLLPVDEKYILHQQLRRSVQGIPANIAEGYGRFYYQDNIRFCYIARGSLEETISHLMISHELGYLKDDALNDLLAQADNLVQLINGYIAYLKRTKQGEKDFLHNKTVNEISEDYLAGLNSDEILLTD